ncbi:bifunctional hydroxymethylpyrimidine kinase/phosphomethylpyrimidine kinase [Halospeciosus flavus]|uniref:Bifunctional hydroxymethylpyrimidine kinase/phosphomethylpyrimidine kinase n=1 Tax=Halospeciosus flavus TaxID=3032283 RepID=A0ABD5Z1Y6_9EURY|nr:bifunctional hydroxymethylpyrimidine kinase/phosphomethylpyrimidine kinase [Halospeciosus flavus]
MTRVPNPDARPVALTVAGSDSGGGAGIQADLKTVEALGVFGTSVLTAATAQHTRGVDSVHHLPEEEVVAQYEAVVSDFDVGAAKTGMLGTASLVETVTEQVATLDAPLVVDPVIVATSGDRLLDEAGEAAYRDLFDHATLVTPNVDEAEVLTGRPVETPADAETAGEELREQGADAALVTGGHLDTADDEIVDVLVTEEGVHHFAHERIDTTSTHGSGCTLSSAVAAHLARGRPLERAVESSVAFAERAVRYPLAVGQGTSPVHHLAGLRDDAAREPTAETVHDVVRELVDANPRRLVPEVGTNVVGATPYAESVGDTAAVEGRVTKTVDGVAPNRGVRFGASSHVARFLLAAREHDPALRFAVNCRYDDEVEAALDALDGPVASYDRREEPASVKEEEGSTMGWGAEVAFEQAGGTPAAVVDYGGHGKEPMVKFLAHDAETLVARVESVLGALVDERGGEQ